MPYGTQAPDTIKGEILDDGTIKSTTDAISAANHSSAEAFFRHLAQLTGGEHKKSRRGMAHSHQHEREHEHTHG